MHFLYASNEGFASVLKASLHSLLANHRDSELTVHIIGQELSEKTISAIERLVRQFGQSVKFIAMPDFDELFGKRIDPKKYTLSAFSRLFVDSLLDPAIERIIYLDCDTIVDSDLSVLWRFDMQGATIGAVNDCRNWRYLRHLGLSANATYINSGVLLIDLMKFRNGDWQEKFRAGMLRYDGLLSFPDNDLICMLMQDDLVILPPEFNMISPVRACNYEEVQQLRHPSVYYSRDEYESAKANPAIIHYTTFFGVHGRPWFEGYESDDGAPFRRHLAATNGRLLPAQQLSALKRLTILVINSPLRPIALRILGTMHAVVKPLSSWKVHQRILSLQAKNPA